MIFHTTYFCRQSKSQTTATLYIVKYFVARMNSCKWKNEKKRIKHLHGQPPNGGDSWLIINSICVFDKHFFLLCLQRKSIFLKRKFFFTTHLSKTIQLANFHSTNKYNT